jgi:hypothetical protein
MLTRVPRNKLITSRLCLSPQPSPASADPEDMGDFDGTSAASSSNKRAAAGSSAWGLGGGSNDDDASDDDDDNRDGKRKTAGVGGGGALSKLRGDASMAASEWGERYASKKVSRQQLKAVRTNEDEENEKKEEDDEKDEEQSDEEEEFDKEEEGDEEEEDESEDDLSDLESEGSNEEGVDASSSGAVQASVFAGVGGEDSVDAQLAALAAEERDARPGGRSAGGGGGLASSDQRLRASRAKALLALYDGVFEFRIAQQAALHATNQLPTPQALAVALPSAPAALGAASRQLQGTLRHLCALREDLRAARSSQGGSARSAAPVDIAPYRSKRRRFDEDGDEEKDDEDEEDEGEDAEEEADDNLLGGGGGGELAPVQASSDRALALVATWRGVAAGFDRSKPYWEATLEQWQRRAQVLLLAHFVRRSFPAADSAFLTRVLLDLTDEKFQRRCRDLVGRGRQCFACPDTDSFSARCQNREEHSPLAIHIATFKRALVMLVVGFALCYGENIDLICAAASFCCLFHIWGLFRWVASRRRRRRASKSSTGLCSSRLLLLWPRAPPRTTLTRELTRGRWCRCARCAKCTRPDRWQPQPLVGRLRAML